MKPEDLKSPFKWDKRRVLFQDRVLYVPDYYDKYDEYRFPEWNSSEIFGNNNPVCVEYCSGNGAWVAAKALAEPDKNWVAIEKRFDRSRKIWSKLKNHNLSNLIVVCGEGFTATKHFFPNESIDHIFINFPDPWPKQRHAKHRIIQPAFIEQLSRLLKFDGRFTFVTDDEDYSLLTIEEMQKTSTFKSLYVDPYFVTTCEGYGTSYFEELWRGKGKSIRYHDYVKTA